MRRKKINYWRKAGTYESNYNQGSLAEHVTDTILAFDGGGAGPFL